MLRSFVAKKDFHILIKILLGVSNNTLRNDTSVVIISGGPSSGKTRLCDVLETLSSTSIHWNGYLNGEGLSVFERELVIVDEEYGNINIDYARPINEGMIVTKKYFAPYTINDPGVLVYVTRDASKVLTHVDNFNRKYVGKPNPRYVVKLHLPKAFSNELTAEDICKACVNEFKIIKANLPIIVKRTLYFLWCSKGLFGKDISCKIAKMIWEQRYDI